MSKYAGLIADLENAGGRSRKIDTFLWLEFFEKPEGKRDSDMVGREPNYTGSIDEAFGFVSKSIPDANCYGVERDPHGWSAYVSRNNVKSGHWLVEAQASTPAVAILIAAMLALQDMEQAA